MSHSERPNTVGGRSRVRNPAYPDRCTSGRFGGSAVDMAPWKRACAGSDVVGEGEGEEEEEEGEDEEGGTQSRDAVEYPPISASLITLQSSTESGEEKSWSTNGPDGPLTPSSLKAVRRIDS